MEINASYHQERLWFIDQFERGFIYKHSPIYHNIPLIMEIKGEINKALVEKSIREVIRRHEVLRTLIITRDNRPVQKIEQEINFNLEEGDWSDCCCNDDSQRSCALTRAIDYVRQPFRLDEGTLIRGQLAQISKNSFILVIGIHHIISDFYSLEMIGSELLFIYRALSKGNSPDLPAPTAHYADFSQWQQGFSENHRESLLFYWKRKLRGKLQPLTLPTDRPRAPVHIYQGGWQAFTLPGKLTRQIRDLSRGKGISSLVLLLAAFKILLHRYSRQEEIVVGTTARNRTQPGTERIVGPLANLLVLRSWLARGETLNDFVSQLQQTVDEAFKYQALPFDQLVLELKPDLDMSRTALFDVLFQYEAQPRQLPELENLEINVIETNLGWGKYDLNLLIRENTDYLSGILVYNRYYHNESTILRLIGHYKVLLKGILESPCRQVSQLDLLTEEEQRQLLWEWNRSPFDYPRDKTLHRLFEEKAAQTPDNTAVVAPMQIKNRTHKSHMTYISYRELNESSDRLAHRLTGKSVQADTIVGIMVERSIEMIVGILAILKAGGAYLPIDPDYPEERIDFMLKDSSAMILLNGNTIGPGKSEIRISKSETNSNDQNNISTPIVLNFEHLNFEFVSNFEFRASNLSSSNLAYIIYTSGTTGQPKGCMVSHKNVISLLKNKTLPFDFSGEDVWTMFHSYNFDFSVWEMYGALLYGGKLLVIPKMAARDPNRYLEILKQERVTVLNQTPSAFYRLSAAHLAQDNSPLSLRYVIFGGDALQPEKLKKWKEKYPGTQLVNMFGITETTIHVTHKEIGEQEIDLNISNIGKPLPTLTVYVLNRQLKLLPIGIPGELCVGGEGLARGYLNNPGLTFERFIELEARIKVEGDIYHRSYRSYKSYKSYKSYIYRTGDQVRWLSHGDMEYLGRIDHQVKIRGFRIEPGEIENRLLKHKDITEAVVISRKQKDHDFDDIYLCAYFVSGKELTTSELREFLSFRLPEYMIPSYFVKLEQVPVTENGKLDRQSLPPPGELRPVLQQTYVEPETQLEKQIAGVWQEILHLEKVGTNDNFFELGGNSLTTIHLKKQLEETLNREIPVVVLFERTTIRSFTQYLTESEKKEGNSKQPVDRSGVIGRAKQTRAGHRNKRKRGNKNV